MAVCTGPDFEKRLQKKEKSGGKDFPFFFFFVTLRVTPAQLLERGASNINALTQFNT